MAAVAAVSAAVAPARQRPDVRRVLGRQLLFIWETRRVAFLLVLLFGALALIEFIAWRIGRPAVATTAFVDLGPLLIATGVLWPLVVWRDEGPAKRQYHRSMPVDVTVHDAARVAAGAIWLAVALAAFYAAGWLQAVLHGQTDLLRAVWPTHPLLFLFVPLLCYLLTSILAVASGRPLEWLIGLYFGMVLLALLSDVASMSFIERGLRYVLGPDRFGLAFTAWGAPNALISGRHSELLTIWLWLGSLAVWFVAAASGIIGVSMARRGRG
jgi:hypothetical protein